MVFFFGIVAFFVALLLSISIRREHAFSGEKRMLPPVDGKALVVETSIRVVKSRYDQIIGVSGGKGASLRVEPEGWVSALLKALGVGRDITSGNARVDRDLVLESDDPRVARWLATDTDAANEIANIFALGTKRLIAHEGRFWACFSGKRGSEDQSNEWLLQVGVALGKLAARVPSRLIGDVSESVEKRAKAMLLLALSSATAITAVICLVALLKQGFPVYLHPYRMYVSAVPFALISGLLLLWCAARWIGDSARARVVLIELCTIGIAGYVLLFLVIAGQANIQLSNHPVYEEFVQIQVYSKRSRRGQSYHLSLPALANNTIAQSDVRIPSDSYWQLQGASHAKIKFKRGWLGHYFLLSTPEPRSPKP